MGPDECLGNRAVLAGVSAIGICVPSIATTRRPANRTVWVGPDPASMVNNSRSGATPTRRIAWLIAEGAGAVPIVVNALVSRDQT